MSTSKITLAPLAADDRERFILDNQESFRFGATEEFGMRDGHMEEEGEIICDGFLVGHFLGNLLFGADDDGVVVLFAEAAFDGEFYNVVVGLFQYHFAGFEDGDDGGVLLQHGKRSL